jgi:hypothetical protein
MKELPVQVPLAQRFFASDWLLRVWLAAFSLGLPLALLRTLKLNMVFAAAWHVWLLFLGVSLLFGFVGFLLGAILFSVMIAPLLDLRVRLNGGPFMVGDMVVVLSGRYKGHRGCVYYLGQGTSVLVELGETEKSSVEVHRHQLLRE